MKRTIISSIIGLGISATLLHGQGSISFNTYLVNSIGVLTTYGNGPLAGTGIGNSFTGELLWSLTNPNDTATTAATATASLNPLMKPGSDGGGSGGIGIYGGPPKGFAYAGYIVGSNLDLIASQVSPDAIVYCEVIAFDGAGWNSATTTFQGHSASFSVQVSSSPNPNQLINMMPFQVYSVPEPSMLAFGGSGLAALLFFRRK